MMEWVLVIYIYAGAFAKGDSVALTTIPGYKSEVDCRTAGLGLDKLVEGSTKNVRSICIPHMKKEGK